jgi:cytochrome P450
MQMGDPARPTGVPRPAPLPRSLPGDASIWARLRNLVGVVRDGADFLDRQHADHGEIYVGTNGLLPYIAVWDPDEAQKIARNESGIWSAPLGWGLVFREIDPATGQPDGLLSRDFDLHRAARKVVQPAFTAKAIKGYIERTERTLERTVPGWIAEGQVSFKREIRTLLARVSNDIFTGFEDDASIERLDLGLTDAWRGVLALSKNPRLSPTFRRAQQGYLGLQKTFRELVPARRVAPGNDLFSLMCAGEDGGGLDDAALVDVFVSLMFAAFDTTSAGVTSMAYLLAKHPAWQERVREEALAVPRGGLDWAALQKMESLEWVWKETLRLMPVTGFLPRRNLREVEVLGHRLPAGSYVGPMTGVIGRHPAWWNEPLKFDPERFSPARAEDKRHPGIYLPFGAGPHACVGMQLANIEAKLFWHALLTRCRFGLARDYTARHTYTPFGMVSGKVELELTRLG